MLARRQRVAGRGQSAPRRGSSVARLLPLVFLLAVGGVALSQWTLLSKKPWLTVSAPPAPHENPSPPSAPSVELSPPASAPGTGLIHIGVATDEEEPFGLIALVNSTVHSSASGGGDLRFHVIVPPESRRRLRQLLESLFVTPSFRMYSLDVGGARAKIVRHLRRREREPVLVSPYRYALAYLPNVLPGGVRRVLWLEPDVLVLADVRPLYETPMHGSPAAAVEDCAHPAASRFNRSRVSLGDALPDGACSLDAGVVLVDTQQWWLLDMTSRVEYWLSLNLRAASFFAHDDAHAPFLLALLPIFERLPPQWAVGGIGQRRPRDQAGRLHPRRIIAGGGEASARALHFSGRWKPWLRGSGTAAGALVECVTPSGVLPCAELWAQYARRAIRTLGWKLPTVAQAARASMTATAVAVAGSSEEAEPLGAPTIEADPKYAEPSEVGGADDGGADAAADAARVHVTIVCGEASPYGLLALLNSTLVHASPRTRARLRVRVFARDESHVALLSAKIAAALPTDASIAVAAPPAERLAKLGGRLAQLNLPHEPFDLPLLWLHHALPPAEVPRTLLLSTDTIVLTDVAELAAAALPSGKACAVIEDCSVLFESVYNWNHPQFSNKHARSSCTFDTATMLIDTQAWRDDGVPNRILDLVGNAKRAQGLYQSFAAAAGGGSGSTLSAPSMLALDRRALRLPARWMARGLAREGMSFGELQYWERLWGQQGIRVPLAANPFRAAHAVASPVRAVGDALLLRYSGGPYLPWLRRCTPLAAASAPLCGRPAAFAVDCARVWRRFFANSLVPIVEASRTDAEGELRLPHGAQRPCVDDNVDEPSVGRVSTATPMARADGTSEGAPSSTAAGSKPRRGGGGGRGGGASNRGKSRGGRREAS